MDSKQKPNRYVGVIVRQAEGAVPFGERGFLSRLSAAGARIGVNVYVFAADWINWNTRTVRAYAYRPQDRSWRRRIFPFPSLIYDRCFCRTRDEQRRHMSQLSALVSTSEVKLLGLGLPGKWDVYRMLQSHEATAAWLPRTELYKGAATFKAWLKEYGTFIMKPHNGTHGKGVMRISRVQRGFYEAFGRDGLNNTFRRRFASARELFLWIHHTVVKGRAYLVQEYLTLMTDRNIPFDIRALVQKSGDGQWTLTGIAARLGRKETLTSNLHGGGTAVAAEPFLIRQYGEESGASAIAAVRRIALAIPPVLELNHGPLLELGIDLGVDRLGRVWVLEVNSKPGRSSFTRLSDKAIQAAAVTSPIRYARYVLDRQLGGHKQ